MEDIVTVYRLEFDADAYGRLRRIAVENGVKDDKSSVVRWAAMQFLRQYESEQGTAKNPARPVAQA